MKTAAKVLTLIAVLVAALATALTEFQASEDVQTVTTVETVVPIPGVTPNVTLDADAQAAAQAGKATGPESHEDARDETPPGVTPADVERIEQSRPAGVGPPQATGGAELLSCATRLVRNSSSRASGSTVSMVVVHYTVSAPGTLDAISNLFDTPTFAASSHLLLEPSGRCVRIVDYSRKAWTQGAFNSVADSVEIVCCLTDPPRSWWVAQPIISKGLLASWLADRLRARGLPPRLVDPVGCAPLAGWTDHNRLECGNSHTDVGAHFPFDIVESQVRALMLVRATVDVWRVSSGGRVLHEERATTTSAGNGYTRSLVWMRGGGEATVRAAEKTNGSVSLRLVTVPRP